MSAAKAKLQPNSAELLARSHLLEQLSEAHREAIVKLASFHDIDVPNTVIVREGEPAENFYVIIRGHADVLKRDPVDGHEVPIATLGPGDHFGETALFQEARRTASIRACTPMVLAMFRARDIRKSPEAHPWLAPFLINLSRLHASRLDRLTSQTVDTMRAEVVGTKRIIALSRVLTWAIASLAVYTFTLGISQLLTNKLVAERLGNVVYIAICMALVWLMVDSHSPLRTFGMRLNDTWLRELGESLAATAGCIGVVTGLKALLLAIVPAYADVPLFADDNFPLLEASLFYAVLMPLHELCARGILQTVFEDMFEHRRRVAFAIVLSNVLFAVVHVHLAPFYGLMAIVVFVPGLLWGAMYARHRSLLGVCVSHVLLGIYAMHVLGIADLFSPP